MALRYRSALVCGALTSVGLAVGPGRLEAKPYEVRIESQPSGATVYIDSKESKPLGQTPLSEKLAPGTHTLIVELDGYVSQVQDINVRKLRKVQRIAVTLTKIDLAIIEVVLERAPPGKNPPGEAEPGEKKGESGAARILIDGKDAGSLQDTIKVPAGPHQVVVVKEGYQNFETWVEAAAGETLKVTAELIPVPGAKGPDGTNGGNQAPALTAARVSPQPGLVAAEQEAAGRPRRPPESSVAGQASDTERDAGRWLPLFALGAGFELGGRRFRPNSGDVQGLREYDASAVPIVRLAAEVNPLAFSPSKWISGWGLYASYGRATALDSTARLASGDDVDVPTEWSELDLGLRYRYQFQRPAFVGLQVGYGSQTFTFDFSEQTEELALEVPDVDYKFWRIGLEGRYGFDRFAALGAAGTRLVSSIGNLGDRFAKTDILALYASGGVAARLTDSIEARLVARYDRYSHQYTQLASNPVSTAESGLDQYYGAILAALFHY